MIDHKAIAHDWLGEGAQDEAGNFHPYTHALYSLVNGRGAMIEIAPEEARAIQVELAAAARENRSSIVVFHPPGGSEMIFIGGVIEFQRVTALQAEALRAKAAQEADSEESLLRQAMILGQRGGARRR